MTTKNPWPSKAQVIKSWSFSRYYTYKLCPLQAKLKFLDKVPEPGNEAMSRGNAIHVLAEKYIKGSLKKLPPELTKFAHEFKRLKTQYKKKISGMVVEETWAFTKDWTETQWNDWVGCWLRIKLDCAHHEDDETLVVTDWKTGKFRPEQHEEYVEQLELYALGALLLHPHIKQVKPRLVYLDLGMTYPPLDEPIVYTRTDLPKLKLVWTKRTKKMLSDTVFAPRPNDKCRFCHYRANNKGMPGGGLCKF